MITLFLLLWLIPIAVNVYIDRNGHKPNYIIVFIVRGMVAILHAALFNPHNVYDWLPILIFQVTSFWIFFELALNFVRNNPLMYYDNSEGDSGFIDRFFKVVGMEAHFIAKVLCFVVMVFSIIVLYIRN